MEISKIPADYQPSENALSDKIILVTGAGDGIGRIASLQYAAHGATVILLGRTVEKLESVYDEIVAAGGPQPAIFPMDLASAGNEDGIACAEAIGQEFPHLDGLLHNASILGERRPIENASFAAWQEVMQVNANAQFLLTHHLLPLLKLAPRASIIFTSSGVGRVGRAYWGAYAISKFAVEGMMQIWADELANVSSIRVNSLNPRATRTAMRAKAYPAEDRSKLPTAEAIMGAYLFLMGEDSKDIDGQQLDARP